MSHLFLLDPAHEPPKVVKLNTERGQAILSVMDRMFKSDPTIVDTPLWSTFPWSHNSTVFIQLKSASSTETEKKSD